MRMHTDLGVSGQTFDLAIRYGDPDFL